MRSGKFSFHREFSHLNMRRYFYWRSIFFPFCTAVVSCYHFKYSEGCLSSNDLSDELCDDQYFGSVILPTGAGVGADSLHVCVCVWTTAPSTRDADTHKHIYSSLQVPWPWNMGRYKVLVREDTLQVWTSTGLDPMRITLGDTLLGNVYFCEISIEEVFLIHCTSIVE